MKTDTLPVVAVIVATRNRAEAIEKYALASLERSAFRDFVCVVWDASDDTATREACESGRRPFAVCYRKASRVGSSSQRNDAVRHVLTAYPSVRVAVFIDDDCELSEDALDGVMETFRSGRVSIVNIPTKPVASPSFRAKVRKRVKRCLRMNRHGAAPFLYNYGGEDETPGGDGEWASGGGMAVDISVFRELHIFFPEAFQRFGGYALGEDFAFSFFVFKKLHGRIVNSLRGHFLHYAAGSSRLDIKNMAASKWYNFHLLFDAVYGDLTGLKKTVLTFAFKLFMYAAALKLLIRARSLDIRAAARGIAAARAALRLCRRESGEYPALFDGCEKACKNSMDWERTW
ncbi:MAG: glycosyltransferase family 2 protein [Synergistaceae bacterium]|nr:glycosyltransferase family 2 protein [Synergistaceae bacterium]